MSTTAGSALLTDLRTERRTEPLGLDAPDPEFAWKIRSTAGQSSYSLQVAAGDDHSDARVVWRTGWVRRSAPFGVRYRGPALRSRTRYTWRVRVRLDDGLESGWSVPASFETGLLEPGDWSATWICADTPPTRQDGDVPYFRTAVDLPDGVVRARAYASALGWYRLLVNGENLTGTALVPRWTPFDQYVEYQVYDAGRALRRGRNVLGMVVADGRFRGRSGLFSQGRIYGDRVAALLQLEVELIDGRRVVVGTDESWAVGRGRIRRADPKFGERADLRVPEDSWSRVEGPPGGFSPASRLPAHPRRLVAEEVERVQHTGRLPGTVSRTPSGRVLVDFGQNFNGVARVRLDGPEGARVKLLYGEVLTPGGELDVTYLSGAAGGRRPDDRAMAQREWFQRDEVVLGAEPVDYVPWFTTHGFRYLVIDGEVEAPSAEQVEGLVVTTPLPQISTFTCSDPRLEQLRTNVMWSMSSNFSDTPTDCPQRESSGWTGDVQVFAPTACQMVDADAYLRRYLRNLVAEQLPDGRVPPVIPSETSSHLGLTPSRLFYRNFRGAAGFADACILVPVAVHRHYGDRETLRRSYAAGKRWLAWVERRAARRRGVARLFGRRVGALERYIVDSGFQFGEWLRPGESHASQMLGNFFGRPVVATAYFAHSSRLLAQTAALLGERADETRYTTLASAVTTAWNAAFVRDDGARIGDDRQDDYVRALAFDLLPDVQRPAALRRLVELIRAADGHLGTGFLSTSLLLDTLVEGGRPDVAHDVLLQTTSPSWLAQIEQGATTIWELWDGYDGNGYAVASHNHFARGAVAAFLHERIAGLAPLEPAYRRFRVHPVIGGGLTSASFGIDTPYGWAASAWRIEDDTVHLEVTVPGGTSAEVHVPGETPRVAGAGVHSITRPLAAYARTGSA